MSGSEVFRAIKSGKQISDGFVCVPLQFCAAVRES